MFLFFRLPIFLALFNLGGRRERRRIGGLLLFVDPVNVPTHDGFVVAVYERRTYLVIFAESHELVPSIFNTVTPFTRTMLLPTVPLVPYGQEHSVGRLVTAGAVGVVVTAGGHLVVVNAPQLGPVNPFQFFL